MIQQEVEEFNLDLSESVLIGDKSSDIQARLNARVRTNIYLGDNGSVTI